MSRSNDEEKDQLQRRPQEVSQSRDARAPPRWQPAPQAMRRPRPRPGRPGKPDRRHPHRDSPRRRRPRRRPASRFRRNFDPVPASEPSMNFAMFTDTHVGQKNRSPNWDFAQHLDKLAGDIMDNTLPCEFVVHLGDGAFNTTAFVNGVGLPDNLKSNYRNNLKDFLISHLNLPFHYVGGNIDLTDYSNNPGPKGHEQRSVRVDEDVHQRNGTQQLSLRVHAQRHPVSRGAGDGFRAVDAAGDV